MFVESIGRRAVSSIAQRGAETVAVVGGGESGELRETVHVDVRGGVGGWVVHRWVQGRGGIVDE